MRRQTGLLAGGLLLAGMVVVAKTDRDTVLQVTGIMVAGGILTLTLVLALRQSQMQGGDITLQSECDGVTLRLALPCFEGDQM